MIQTVLFFFLLGLPPSTFSQTEEICDEPTQSTSGVEELVSQVEAVEESKFSEKFCKAFSACSEFRMKSMKNNEVKEMEEYYKKLPQKIEEQKKALETAKAGSAGSYHVEWLEKSIKELEEDKAKYDLHLSDPSKYPHPMKEKGIGLTPEEKIKYDLDKYIEQMGSYYKNLASQDNMSKEKIWTQIDELVKKSPLDMYGIHSQFQLLTYAQSQEAELKIAKAYEQDPSKLPELLKEKGIGLTPEEMPAFQLKQAESYFESLASQMEDQEKFIALLKKQKNELKGADPDGQLSLVETWLPYYEQMLLNNKQSYENYLAYKKDPSSDPDFLKKSGVFGAFGGYGGYGSYGGGYGTIMGGGLVGGTLGGGSSSSSSCSEANSNYQSALSTMSSQGAGSCGLKPEEMSALKYYSDSGYGCLNSYLRSSDNRDENIDYMIKALNDGLDKLPSYQGVVKRGASLPESIREAHGVGDVIEYDAFTSSSTNSGFSGQDMFIIQSESGKPIMGFSSHRSENEVLFKSGTKFKVLDKKEKDGVHYYIMAEVLEEKKIPKAEAIIGLGDSGVGSYSSTKNPDSYLCPVDEKAIVPKVINQTVVPQFSYPAGSP